MRTVYKGQRDAVIRAVKNSPLMDRAAIMEENAGLHFLLKIRTEMTDRELTAAAARKGIKITCLSEYYREEKNDSHTIVVNYSCIDVQKIEQAVYRLYTALC